MNRENRFVIMCSERERGLINAEAKRVGLSASAWARMTMIDAIRANRAERRGVSVNAALDGPAPA